MLLPQLHLMSPGLPKKNTGYRFFCAAVCASAGLFLVVFLQTYSAAQASQLPATQSSAKPLTLDEAANLIKQNKKDTQLTRRRRRNSAKLGRTTSYYLKSGRQRPRVGRTWPPFSPLLPGMT